MAKDIDLEEAAKWSKKEYLENRDYLESRGRLADVNHINEIREEAGKAVEELETETEGEEGAASEGTE